MVSISMYDVLVRPIITEKSDSLSAFNKYTFEVSARANKLTVKKAVEAIYSVDVGAVNIINIKGKTKRFRGHLGRRSDKKKAIVSLKNGQTIDFAGEIK